MIKPDVYNIIKAGLEPISLSGLTAERLYCDEQALIKKIEI